MTKHRVGAFLLAVLLFNCKPADTSEPEKASKPQQALAHESSSEAEQALEEEDLEDESMLPEDQEVLDPINPVDPTLNLGFDETYFTVFREKNEYAARKNKLVPYQQITGKNSTRWIYEEKGLGAEILDKKKGLRYQYEPHDAAPLPADPSKAKLFLGMLPSTEVLTLIREKGAERKYDPLDLSRFKAVSVVVDFEFKHLAPELRAGNPPRAYQVSSADNAALSIRKLEEAVKAIDRGLASGTDVYTHCKSGVGRSATAVAAWYIKHYHMPAMVAATLIKERRPKVVIGVAGHYHQKAIENYEVALQMKGKEPKEIEADPSIQKMLQAYKIPPKSPRYLKILQESKGL